MQNLVKCFSYRLRACGRYQNVWNAGTLPPSGCGGVAEMLIPHLCYYARICHSRSNRTSV